MNIFAETERLIIREWSEDDITSFTDINQALKIMAYFLSPYRIKRGEL